jgi:hypothetical protein
MQKSKEEKNRKVKRLFCQNQAFSLFSFQIIIQRGITLFYEFDLATRIVKVNSKVFRLLVIL